MKKTIVIALGGNALLQRGEAPTAENQYQNIERVADVIVQLAREFRVAIVHGNGPQVGLLALQNLAYDEVPAYPLDILVAQTQGMLGYMIAQSISQHAGSNPVSTLLTRVEVDAADEAFGKPGKFIGPVYRPEEESALTARYGWTLKADGNWRRRVVASPRPQRIVDLNAVHNLLAQGDIVICGGGGGAPVIARGCGYQGVEAVIDKDLVAALLARELNAEYLMILTDADAVYEGWGTPQARALRKVTPDELRPFAAPDGAMGPKAEAVIEFVEKTGKTAYIGALNDALAIVRHEKGTCVRNNFSAV